MSRLFAKCAALCLAAGCWLMVAPSGGASAQSIYDSQVEQKLTLTPAQRPKVEAIVAEGRKEFGAILAKYKIDPNARPIFDKLKAASDELISYRRKQRAAMAKVLTPDQLDQYDDIIETTSARVRKAAQ